MSQKIELEAFVNKYRRKYGERSAFLGSQHHSIDVVPTGILALDYALGIAGWPRGHCVEVLGAPNIGKTSILGYGALAQAQRMGLQCGIINTEPRFDKDWVARRGVDVDNLPVMYPDNGEQAFDILRDWTTDPDVPIDYILFDSVGMLVAAADLEAEAKKRVGGQSGLITEGIKRIIMSAWKNNVGIMFINQQRDKLNSPIPGQVDSPGGWAIKHAAMYRIHLKPGRERYMAKVDGENRMIGREMKAVILKSAAGDSLGAQATFDFYHQEVEGFPFGVDVTSDVINTGLKTKIIEQAGAWYKHDLFPKGQLKGRAAVDAFIAEKPEVVDEIRNEVIEVMERKRAEAQAAKPQLEAV